MFSGYEKESEAVAAKERMEDWFISSHPDHKDWAVNTTVYKTSASGFVAKLEASKAG